MTREPATTPAWLTTKPGSKPLVSAVETLETYAGLWPDSEARTRAAVDDLGLRSQAPQSLDVPSKAQRGRGRRPTDGPRC
jgi:hypothetical protein